MARALIMFAGPLANFLLSIFIFLFLNTPDPQTKAVIKTIDSSIIMSSKDEFILPGDEIYAINSLTISDPKGNLELLAYAGYTGAINLSLKRPEIDDLVNVAVVVKDSYQHQSLNLTLTVYGLEYRT